MRQPLLDLVIYSEGAFSYNELEQYPVGYILEINQALDRKNEAIKKSMEKSKGTNRRTF
tara:strand:+ start:114 stop:290 length:177 start_codon:yes stop_codon:yes gene_type:complete